MHSLLSASVQPHCRLVDARFRAGRVPYSASVRTVASVFIYDTWDWRASSSIPDNPQNNRGFVNQPQAVAATPELLSFASFGSAKLLDADIFNTSRVGVSERERCISLLGEDDIIEHPVTKAVYSAQVSTKNNAMTEIGFYSTRARFNFIL